MSIFVLNIPLASLIFLETSLVFSILLFSFISFHCSFKKTFLSLLAILWNSVFSWVCMHAKSLQSCMTLCSTVSWSMPDSSVCGILQAREYWRGLPCPLPGGLPDPGIEPMSPVSPALQANSLSLNYQGSPQLGISFLSPLPFTSLLSSTICKATPDNNFAFLHFFFFFTLG